ncbi:MAG: HAMP domain-containing histidine kinase [Lachnospiraceae bacterium]|jgi:two-component system sensor histidine kinase SenX3|nr:HAMP domain-containing histidine kinase [Lachnospiraceae bacterium]
MRGIRSTYAKLNQMVDAAIDGSFTESEFNETELSKLEAKWKRFLVSAQLSQEQLQEERAGIQALVSDISHQLKTPLANILLYAQLLEEQGLEEGSRALAGEIKRQSEKLEFLIQSLVKASRLETGTFQMFPKEQEVSPMLQEVVSGARIKAAGREVQIGLPEPEAGLHAVFDRKWTAEALLNLLDNAVKYSHPGSRVTVSVTGYEMFVRIGIHDQGIGIPEGEIALVYQRFYRGSQARGEEGVGLGLYLARQIAEGQGGYLFAETRLGEGSSFYLFLPKETRCAGRDL